MLSPSCSDRETALATSSSKRERPITLSSSSSSLRHNQAASELPPPPLAMVLLLLLLLRATSKAPRPQKPQWRRKGGRRSLRWQRTNGGCRVGCSWQKRRRRIPNLLLHVTRLLLLRRPPFSLFPVGAGLLNRPRMAFSKYPFW